MEVDWQIVTVDEATSRATIKAGIHQIPVCCDHEFFTPSPVPKLARTPLVSDNYSSDECEEEQRASMVVDCRDLRIKDLEEQVKALKYTLKVAISMRSPPLNEFMHTPDECFKFLLKSSKEDACTIIFGRAIKFEQKVLLDLLEAF